MDYETEIINIIHNINNNDVLAFYYGLIDELTQHLIETGQLIVSGRSLIGQSYQ